MCCERLLAQVPIAGIDASARTVHLDLEPTPTAARAARAFLAENASGLDEAGREAAAVCASELVTNGVLHARTPLTFGVALGTDELLVTVADGGAGRPEQPPHDDERTSGRGLVLVGALSERWGVAELDDKKIVWFTLPRSAR